MQQRILFFSILQAFFYGFNQNKGGTVKVILQNGTMTYGATPVDFMLQIRSENKFCSFPL
jgi:hypothetical protein